jgi:hypothetical protein
LTGPAAHAFGNERIRSMFKRKKVALARFALCERVTATVMSSHHIRPIGADETGFPYPRPEALCGAEVAWDTHSINLDTLEDRVAAANSNYWYCPACVEKARLLTA